MKAIIALMLFFSTIAFGGVQTIIRDASATAIPAAYTTAGAELLSNVRANAICCVNHTDAAVGLAFDANTAAAASDSWYLAAGASFCFDRQPMANKLHAKGWAGAISSGIVSCRVWIVN
jgi:hypothetical protein